MQVISTIADFRAWRQAQNTLGFVPTMGNLHQGHLALVQHAQQHCAQVAVSIFVNRLQFGVGEDFDAYPRTLAQDLSLLEAQGVDAVFVPDEATLYPVPQTIQVTPPAFADWHCGASRPGHFIGVATVVTKLLNIVQPDAAFFGQKDYQQLAIIRALAEQLNFNTQIHGIPTVRADDGLALSSRNGYLSPEERQIAPQLYQELQHLARQIASGAQNFLRLTRTAQQNLQQQGWQPGYLTVCSQKDLSPLVSPQANIPLVILAAAKLGKTRLIDNLEINPSCVESINPL